MNDHDRALSALHTLDPGCPRDEWVRIGMAAKAAGLTLEDFTDWSAGASNFAGERDCASAWRSFHDGAVGAGTLYYLAQQTCQWKDPARGRLNGHRRRANSDGGPVPIREANGAHTPAMSAAEVWAQCEAATAEHPYIAAKGGIPDGLRVVPLASALTIARERVAGWLVVPVLDRSGASVSLQFIASPGIAWNLKTRGVPAKLNLPGAAMAGTFTVGTLEPGGTAYLVEGIATAWACWRATGRAAVVCFGWGLVKARAKEMRDCNPSAELVIVPDVGKEAEAAAIASEVGAKVAPMPDDWPQNSDMADLAARVGSDGVEVALSRAFEPALRYRLLTSSDVHALPDRAWRIRGALPAEGLASIFGPSGAGKSFLGLDAAAVIGGAQQEWFGYRVIPAPVVYCALEGEGGIRARVKAWEQANGAEFPTRFVLQDFKLTESQDVLDLAAAVERAGPCAVVFIDTLNRAAPTADENSSKDMGAILEGAKELQRRIGGLVLLVHHRGKDATKGMRGHSSLFAALDAVLEVDRIGERREWTIAKCKDGEDGTKHGFRLRAVSIGTDEDGDPVTSCVVEAETGPGEVKRAKLPQGGNQRIVWEALGPLLAKGRTGIDGAPLLRPCIELESAITDVAGRLPVEPERRIERAKTAIAGLVSRGLLGCKDGWLWQV